MKSVKIYPVLLVLLIIEVIAAGVFYFMQYGNSDSNQSSTSSIAEPAAIERQEVKLSWGPYVLYPESPPESENLNFNSNIFEGLVAFNKDNKIAPVLATKWDNPDNLTWRFYLSSKAKFSNGDLLTAQDVKFSYDYFTANKNLLLSATLPPVSEVRVVDDHTIEFVTAAPDPLLLNRLAWGGVLVMSKKEVETNGIKNYIGSGPYLLTDISEQSCHLTRNENYWGEKPKVQKITYVTTSDKINDFIAGKIDLITYVAGEENVDKFEALVESNDAEVKRVLQPNIIYMDLDTTRDKSPYIDSAVNPLKNKDVRLAMYQAINGAAVLKQNPGSAEATQLVSQGIFGFNPEIKRPKYDVDAAKALLKKAGYENGFSLVIDVVASPGTATSYQVIADELSAIGIKATLNQLDQNSFFGKIGSKDSSAYIIGYSADTKDAGEIITGLLQTPSETAGMYNLGYSNAEVDQLATDVASTLNQRLRLQKIQQAMATAMTDVAKIPLIQGYVNIGYKNDILFKPRLDGLIKVRELAGKATE